MSMTVCGRCARRYDRDVHYFSLCPECYDAVGLYGDADSSKFWRLTAAWLNNEWTVEEMKELADSGAGQRIVEDILEAMDVGMKIRLLRREINKME